MLNLADIRKMTTQDINQEIKLASKELFKVKLDIASGQEKSVHRVKSQKKYIARLNTILSEKKLIAEIKKDTEELKEVKSKDNK